MFKVGETVCYSQSGVCKIEKKCLMGMGGAEQEYFVLTPLFKSGSVVYVPCENRELMSRMTPLLTPEEIEALLATAKEDAAEWIRDFRRRSEWAKKTLISGNRRALLTLIHSIYRHKKEMVGEGKRIHTTDDYFLKDAEDLIFFEFSHVLGKSYPEIAERIRTLFEYER